MKYRHLTWERSLLYSYVFDYIFSISVSRDGGIGRRARLKIWWWQHRVGSIPTLGTMFFIYACSSGGTAG
jgi:hypothetical protein